MDFQLPSILQLNASVDANDTANAGGGSFPAGIMDSFLLTAGQASPLMQMVLFVYRNIGSHLGFDPTSLLTLLGFVWGVSKMGSQVFDYMNSLIKRHFMCTIYITDDDHIYYHLMKWLSHQQSIRKNLSLMAQTVWKSAWEEEDDLEDALFFTDGGDGDSGSRYLNFSNQAARSSPRFVPPKGRTKFWYKRTYFIVSRYQQSFIGGDRFGAFKSTEEITVSCYGRSIEPIKRLLADAKGFYYLDTSQKTTIYRPNAKDLRRNGSNMWQQVARRPVRPMRTVVLDQSEKRSVLADANDYLHPTTPNWYASRGIPLRRGYLFHGPPGTGKTSFSFALAGVFGIDIYVISLQDVTVTEEDLAVLFNRLPRRCIVLLEDIDAAGLRRKDDEKEKPEDKQQEKGKEGQNQMNSPEGVEKGDAKSQESKGKKRKKQGKVASSVKKVDESVEDVESSESSESTQDTRQVQRLQSHQRHGKRSREKKQLRLENISLSGLLNAIDGVASHEGRILIMTTNKPESLDEALLRPGRVDVQVGFKNASSVQAAELFYRMYETVSPPKPKRGGDTGAEKTIKNTPGKKLGQAPKPDKQVPKMSAQEVKSISEEFGRRIPEGMLSPAEIQGFLLKRKTDPRVALDDVDGWIQGMLKQKESHSKVVTVQ